MWDNKFVISISGNGECGKDTAALFLSKLLKIGYQQSTSACVVDPWWNEIQSGFWSANTSNKPSGMEHLIIEKNDYKSKQEFHDDRRNRRMDWVDYIEHFNLTNGNLGIGLYTRSVESGNQILTGIRRTGQFTRCLSHVIDFAIWVDRPGANVDVSQEYDSSMCDYTIHNDGTLDDLKIKCRIISEVILRHNLYQSFRDSWISKHIIETDLS